MLILAKKHGGFTLMELMITMIVVAILFSVAAPEFTIMAQNAKIRGTADAILSGLQLARAEGVKRNTLVRFQLTDSLSNTCILSPATPANASSNWVISLADPTGQCAVAFADPPLVPVPGDTNPYIIQSRTGAEGSTNVVVQADQTTIAFNGMGRLTPTPAANLNIEISNPTGGLCAINGGPMRCMRIIISTGGQVRMCNPAVTNLQGC